MSDSSASLQVQGLVVSLVLYLALVVSPAWCLALEVSPGWQVTVSRSPVPITRLCGLWGLVAEGPSLPYSRSRGAGSSSSSSKGS